MTDSKTVDIVQVSRKRQLTATTTTVVVSAVLGIAANALIGRLGTQIHNKIVPPSNPE